MAISWFSLYSEIDSSSFWESFLRRTHNDKGKGLLAITKQGNNLLKKLEMASFFRDVTNHMNEHIYLLPVNQRCYNPMGFVVNTRKVIKMDAVIFLYAFGVWVIFGILTVINGVIRNKAYAPKIGEYPGHVVSTIIAIGFVVVGTYIFLRFMRIDYDSIALLLIGGFWLILTILFEFVFGHYIVGNPWQKLLADYNILKGRLWSLFLLTLLIAPLLIGLLLKESI